jgi:hypothetical protein
MKVGLFILLLISGHLLFGQITFERLYENKNFNWLADSAIHGLTIYYQSDSWTGKKLEIVRQRITNHLNSTKAFINIDSYEPTIHLFIVDSREEMKKLVGWETNGSAFYKYNTLTGIASERINSIYSNHELFHVIAMNLWGIPDIWLNEGMAVYSDNKWHGHELYELTKYLVDNNRHVTLKRLIKDFRKVDDLISYPLIGSFVKFIDETYGRDIILEFWKTKTINFKRLTGKTINELELDWLTKVKTADYKEIKYPPPPMTSESREARIFFTFGKRHSEKFK